MLSYQNKENFHSSLGRKTDPVKPRPSSSQNKSVVFQSFNSLQKPSSIIITKSLKQTSFNTDLTITNNDVIDTLCDNAEGSQQPLSEETKLFYSQNTNVEKFHFVTQTQFNEECEYIETEIRENDIKNDTSEVSEMEYNLANFDCEKVESETNTPEKLIQTGVKTCSYCNQQLDGNSYSLEGRESDLIDLGLSTKWNENIDSELYLPIYPFDVQYRYNTNVAYDIANEITNIQVQKEKESFLGQYLNSHKTVTPTMRMHLIDWIFEFSSNQDCIEVFFISVQIIDHFLNKTPSYPPNELQLLGASAVSLATKMEKLQIHPIRYTWIRNILTLSEIYNFERTILNTLSFDILFPTSFGFLQRVMLAFSQEDRNQTMKQSIIILCCLHSTYHFCKYPQQLLASAVLFYVRLFRQSQREAEFDIYRYKTIQEELQQNGVLTEQTTNFLKQHQKKVTECWNESATTLMHYETETIYSLAQEIHQCITFYLTQETTPPYIGVVVKIKKQNKIKKPAKFDQGKKEFNTLLNEVKKLGSTNMKGMGKKQLTKEFRMNLGLKPKTIKTPYAILQRQISNEKNRRENYKSRVNNEEAVLPKSWLPKKVKKTSSDVLKTTAGSLHDGILKFDIDKDNMLQKDNSFGKYKDKNGLFGNTSKPRAKKLGKNKKKQQKK
ncbi:hypothetical protein QTN25_007740 [Entamoeba marina]